MVSKEVLAPKARFEIPRVNEALYTQTREALAKEGYTFIVAIEPVSIGQLATNEATSQHFDYFNASENVCAIVPPQMEVAINPNNLRIKKSNSKSTDTQIKMIQREEKALKGKLPQEVRDLIGMCMPNASVLVQLDFKYHEETGGILFTDWFGRTDDEIAPDYTLNVGRNDPTNELSIGAWNRSDGYDPLFAVRVIVLPRKLTV